METYDLPSLVESDLHSNITDLLVDRAAKTPNLPLYARENAPGEWVDVSASAFLQQVRELAKGFIAAGIQQGQTVAIMSHTSYEWTLTDFALWFAGAIPVPIYETSSPSQMAWILTDSKCVAILVEDQEMVDKLAEIKGQSAFLREVWRYDQDSLAQLVKLGKNIDDATLEARRTAATLDDLSTIIYLSLIHI